MKLHFSASEHDEAKFRLAQLTKQYGQVEIEDATHIVALGGDGHLLHVLQDTLSFGLPVFGMNCGRLGFLMNEYGDKNLTDRIAAAGAGSTQRAQRAKHAPASLVSVAGLKV